MAAVVAAAAAVVAAAAALHPHQLQVVVGLAGVAGVEGGGQQRHAGMAGGKLMMEPPPGP